MSADLHRAGTPSFCEERWQPICVVSEPTRTAADAAGHVADYQGIRHAGRVELRGDAAHAASLVCGTYAAEQQGDSVGSAALSGSRQHLYHADLRAAVSTCDAA